MTKKEIYDQVASEHGNVVIIVKKSLRVDNEFLPAIGKLNLHSFKIDEFNQDSNICPVTCSIYLNKINKFVFLKCELENNLWHLTEESFKTLSDIFQDSNGLNNLRNSNFFYIDTIITNELKGYLPKTNSYKTGILKDVFFSFINPENLGLLTNELVGTIHTNEENFYLSDDRIKDETKDGIKSLLEQMSLPRGTQKITNIELNGAFRISFE